MSGLGNKEIMAKNIRRYLDAKGITMKDLSIAINVPYTTVCDWCKGATYPRIDKIELMSQFFGINKADLVEDPAAIKEELLERAFSGRPEMRMLFSVAENATKEDIEKAIKIIEALKSDDYE